MSDLLAPGARWLKRKGRTQGARPGPVPFLTQRRSLGTTIVLAGIVTA